MTMIRIIGVGDIMPGGVLTGVDQGYMSPEITEILKGGDIRVGTLETAVGNSPTFSQEKMSRKKDVIYTLDRDMPKLTQLGMDIVSLANNHFFDLGEEGAKHTIELLDKMGIQHIGAGKNLQEASKPAVMVVGDKKVAFVGFCDWRDETVGWCPMATDNAWGVNPMYDDHVQATIRKCKDQYDYVVSIPHWGREGHAYPTDHEYKMAKLMMASGADLVLGGHTHCIQPIYHKNNKSVVFSMGNFLFPDRLIAPPRSTYYPEGPMDIASLPTTERYPFVDTVTLKKWRKYTRYGQIVTTQIGDGTVRTQGHITRLTEDNRIELWQQKYPHQRQVKTASLALDSGCYLLFYQIQRLKNYMKPHVKKMIGWK